MTPWALLLGSLFLVNASAAQQNHTPAAQAQSTVSIGVESLTPEQKANVQQLAKLQKDFGKKMNSPGVELSLKEIRRSHAGDRTLVKYSLYATGFPPTTFILYQVQLDGSFIKTLEGVTISAQGQALCGGQESRCQGNGPNDSIDLVVYAGKGEPKRFALVSEDGAHLRGFVGVVPFPNATTDKSCRLESVIGTPNGELTYLQGSGFEPDAELTIDSHSYDENRHYTAKAGVDGSYFAVLLPYVLGKKSGYTVFEIKSKNCSPKLTFQWGENSYHLE
jgi:hypothetical protein